MLKTHFLLFLLINAAALNAYTAVEDSLTESGVSEALARQRAASLDSLSYAVHFIIPEARQANISAELELNFLLRDTTTALILDFKAADGAVSDIMLQGRSVPWRTINGHLVIPARLLTAGKNRLQISFTAGDDPLNRNENYLYTLFVPGRASEVFPCFDQPNLKARFTLTLTLPAHWTAVANGPLQRQTTSGDWQTWSFAATPPLPTYLFAFAAGEFQRISKTIDGHELEMYHRETNISKLARNSQAIFGLHASALNWLENYTGIDYPFQKFAFVLIPDFQYNGMEHPGAVLYRASSLLLDESATQRQKLGRASLIAHETAHMWFGDLVTMNWFDDVWTKEVFANFMAAKIVNPAFPDIDHRVRFLLSHFPPAYAVDRSAGANPIRQHLDNLAGAGSLYGAIIYQKAPIVMQHLENRLGARAFRDGLRDYLRKFSYANATWPDLIAILDQRSDEDLRQWSHVWVEEAGRPRLRTVLHRTEDRIAGLSLLQDDPAGQGRIWPQKTTLLLLRQGADLAFSTDVSAASTPINEAIGEPIPQCILPDSSGLLYGEFIPDSTSMAFLLRAIDTIDNDLWRASAWLILYDNLLNGTIPPEQFFATLLNGLHKESSELICNTLLRTLRTLWWRFLSADQRTHFAARLENLLRERMQEAGEQSFKALWFNALQDVVLSEEGVAWLFSVWSGATTVDGLTFSQRQYTRMALELAVRPGQNSDSLLTAQLARLSNPDRRARLQFVMPALSTRKAERDSFFISLKNPARRTHEPWVLESLRYLNHPLRAAGARHYLRPGLELLRDIQKTGDIFFPKRWLDALFSGHTSPQAAAIVRQFLEEHPDYPERLRGKILQSADLLFRAARLQRPRDAGD